MDTTKSYREVNQDLAGLNYMAYAAVKNGSNDAMIVYAITHLLMSDSTKYAHVVSKALMNSKINQPEVR
jgi:hypothetical protein